MDLPPGRLTDILIWVTFAAWAIVFGMGWQQQADIMFGFIPAEITSGAWRMDPVRAALSPLSATLVHGGLMHLLFNLLTLLVCGRFVERALGMGGMAALYVAGAYAAALARLLVTPESPVVGIGASTSVSAVIGAYAVLFSVSKAKAIGPISAKAVQVIWLALAWIGIQLLTGLATRGFGTQIDIISHIGGFLAGILLARPLLRFRFRKA